MIRFRKYTLAHLDSLHKETGKKIVSSLMVVLACAGQPALARLLYSAAYVQRLPNLRRLPMHRGSLCTLLHMHSAPYVQCSLCIALPMVQCSLCIALPMYTAAYVQRLLCTALPMYTVLLMHSAPYVHRCLCIVLPIYSASYA